MLNQNMNLECFSKNLKHLIKKNNIRNVDLANYLGISKSAISNYISGSVPKTETIFKIASYFDVNIENLISKKSDETEIGLNEEGKLVYKIPLFCKDLLSDKIVYRNENYIGIITSPIPTKKEHDCYAVKCYDNSMKNYGFAEESIAVFSAATQVSDGEIAAVFIKSKKRIFIRRVKFKDKKIELISDNGSEIYKISRDNCDAVILGKVVSATFFPNT